MGNVSKEYFDLQSLLWPDELNIRSFADKYASTVDEYFAMLEKFLSLAPDTAQAIDKFAKMDSDKEACKSLDEMAAFLRGLECEKFITSFYSMLDSYEKGNWRLASFHAERIADEFKCFFSRIYMAKRSKMPENAAQGRLSLKEYIKILDREDHKCSNLGCPSKPLILAVDDSPVLLKSLSAVLSDTYKVFTLPKPLELEKVLQKLTPDLFLLDYLMPERNGFELIPIIRRFAEHKDTPIIFLTSEGTIDTLTTALALGACDFAVKPLKPEILREKIAKHLARKE